MLGLLGLLIGLVGLFFLLVSPGLGVVALIVALLLFAAQGNANRRAKEQKQAAVEERRHRELVEATRQGQTKQ